MSSVLTASFLLKLENATHTAIGTLPTKNSCVRSGGHNFEGLTYVTSLKTHHPLTQCSAARTAVSSIQICISYSSLVLSGQRVKSKGALKFLWSARQYHEIVPLLGCFWNIHKSEQKDYHRSSFYVVHDNTTPFDWQRPHWVFLDDIFEYRFRAIIDHMALHFYPNCSNFCPNCSSLEVPNLKTAPYDICSEGCALTVTNNLL